MASGAVITPAPSSDAGQTTALYQDGTVSVQGGQSPHPAVININDVRVKLYRHLIEFVHPFRAVMPS